MTTLETVRNRLKQLATAPTESPGDVAGLQDLEPLLAEIGPADLSKYLRLLTLIQSDWAWRGKDPKDRLVLFTGRRETQRFLMEHLASDLGLPSGAVVGLDGAMPDVEQTRVVEQFAQEKEAVRILVATEVASEGLNLHYLSHRLVHVDIPWSLMTLQQRNGRIDRYGQPQQPQIRYLLTHSRSEGMGDAEKILRVLIRKDHQAQKNIGDPSVFLRVFDAQSEEEEIGQALEAGAAEALEQRMDANAQPYLEQSGELNLFEEMFGAGSGGDDHDSSTALPEAVERRQPFSVFPSLWTYVDRALQAVGERMAERQDVLDLRVFEEQERLEISPPSDLQRRYERYPKELRPPSGQGFTTRVINKDESDDPSDPALRLATMHRVKGLEFDQMFIPGLDHSQLPLRYELDQRPDQISKELFEQQERSLLHVAATRAKKRVVVTYSGKPSPLLAQAGPDCD